MGSLYGSRMGYHGNMLLRSNGYRRGRDKKPYSVGAEGGEKEKDRDKKPNFVVYSGLNLTKNI